jgi:xylulokinase
MADPLLLGIDLGTSSAKVVLATPAGAIVGSAAREYPIARPRPGYAEQDPDGWWQAIVACTRTAVAEVRTEGPVAERIAAISLAGQMHGTVLLAADQRHLGPAIIWPDQRSRQEIEGLTQELGPDQVIRLTGGPLATGFLAATVRWIATHEPERLARARHILTPKDAIRLRLTGEVAIDPSDASGTGLLDPATRRWAPALLAAIGLEAARLAPIRPSASIAGELRAEAADELGLRMGTPVVTGGADTPAGLLGAGLTTPSAILVTISTGGTLSLPAFVPDTDPTGRSHTFCSVLEPTDAAAAGWYRMAAILSAGLALRWLRDSVFEDRAPDAYDRMLAMATDVPPGSRGLLFLPYLAGERNPHLDPDARGVFLGLTAAHGRAELVNAVVEGVTLAMYDASRALAASGPLPDSIVLAGGGAGSRIWRQIVADVFGLPVRPLEMGAQAALGACLLAGAGIGLFDAVAASSAWTLLGPVIEPDDMRHGTYASAYGIFRDAYPMLRDDFGRLKALAEGTASP